MMPAPRQTVARYAIAFAGFALALVVQAATWPAFAPTPFLLFVFAVAFAAWRGGPGPALLVGVTSALTAHFLFPVITTLATSPAQADVARSVAFLAVTVCIAALAARHEFTSARLTAVIDSTADAVFTQTFDGAVMSWNAGAARLFGRPDRPRGRSLAELGPTQADAIAAVLDRVRRGETVAGFAIDARDADDRPVRVSLTVAPLRSTGGRIVAASVMARDITERVRQAGDLARAEDEARRVGEENRRLYEAGRLLTRSLDPGDVVRTLRRLITEALPCDGMVVSSFSAEEQRIRCRYAWVEGEEVDASNFPPVRLNPDGHGMQSRVITRREPLVVDDVEAYTREPGTRYYYVDHDGTVHDRPTEEAHTQSALMVPLILEGQVTGVLQVMCNRRAAYNRHDLRYVEALATAMTAADRNATLYARAREELEQRRRVEAELRVSEARARELAETLERRVAERTAELNESHLKLTESHSQMVDFSYSVSHDLRAPLRAIRGYLDALVEELGQGVGERAASYTTRISEATERMDRLIRELLNYSRLGRIELAHEAVPLSRCVREALVAAESELSARGAEVRNLVDDRIVVVGHPPALTQAVWNLVNNAAKFVREDTRPVITLRAERRDGRARLWVEDNGIGIAPEHRTRIFKVFERLHADDRYAGLGIGLAMVERAVARMQGEVGVLSEPDGGSRFWIELPECPRVGAEEMEDTAASS